MDDTQLDDLKQFITATVGQAEARIKQEITSELRNEFRTETRQVRDELRDEMRSGFASIGDSIERLNEKVDGHETRIATLEQKAA